MSLSDSMHGRIRGFASVAVVAALVLAGFAAPARAAAPDQKPAKPLPAVGTSFDLDVTSNGIEFTLDGKVLTGAPMRGTLAVGIEANPADRKKLSVEAKPSDLRLTTKAAQTHAITVQQDNAVVDERSVLRLVKPKPVKLTHVMALDLRFTVTLLAAGPAEAERTYQLETTEPVRLKGSLTAFPPRNARYELVEPVTLAAVDESVPGTEEMLLSGFDVIVNQSA